MRLLISLMMVGALFTLAACQPREKGDSDYSYEAAAPYADERTASGQPEGSTGETASGDAVFRSSQRK